MKVFTVSISALLLDVLRRLLFRYWRFNRWNAILAHVPELKCAKHPVLGAWPEFLKNQDRVHDWRTALTVSQGIHLARVPQPFFIRSSSLLYTSDPTVVRHILKDQFPVYSKLSPSEDFFWSGFVQLLGRGIFTAQHGIGAPDAGALWQIHRKVASNIFSRNNFNEGMAEVFMRKAEVLKKLLAEKASSSTDGRVVDMQKLFFAFSMDSIMEIFCGIPTFTLTGGECTIATEFDNAQKLLMLYSVGSLKTAAIFDLIAWPLGGRGLLSMLHKRMHPHGAGLLRSIRKIDQGLAAVIEARRKDPNLHNCSDLLALFMRASDPDTGKHFTDDDLRAIVLNFFMAGRDTTASLLSWLFFELSIHPGIQERLAAEVSGSNYMHAKNLSQEVQKLEYLNAVVFETLRLHPPVPLNPKVSMSDDRLPDGTCIPAGSRIFYLVYAMGRDPDRYPEPLEFRPERWIPFKEPLPHEFPQFQAGPRICLGKEMALFETKLLTAELLRCFRFSLKDGELPNIRPGIGVTMAVRNGLDAFSNSLLLAVERL